METRMSLAELEPEEEEAKLVPNTMTLSYWI